MNSVLLFYFIGLVISITIWVYLIYNDGEIRLMDIAVGIIILLCPWLYIIVTIIAVITIIITDQKWFQKLNLKIDNLIKNLNKKIFEK